jgi:hypothetical protein
VPPGVISPEMVLASRSKTVSIWPSPKGLGQRRLQRYDAVFHTVARPHHEMAPGGPISATLRLAISARIKMFLSGTFRWVFLLPIAFLSLQTSADSTYCGKLSGTLILISSFSLDQAMG